MGDFLKRNWPLVAVISLTLIVSGIMVVLIISSAGGVSEATEKLLQVRREKEEINKYRYQLTEPNKQKATKVASEAWDQYDGAFKDLYELDDDSAARDKRRGKYLTAKKNEVSPAQALTDVTRQCEVMKSTLIQRKVDCAGAGSFTFGDIVNTTNLPQPAQIPFITRDVMIVDEIVRVIAESGVSKLNSIERPQLDLVDQGGDYKYLPFKISVAGTYPTVRQFVNDLQEAEYLFIVRKLNVTGTDNIGALSTPPPAKSTKGERIVFKELSTVTAEVEFDYVEVTKAARK